MTVPHPESTDALLRRALGQKGQRFTGQRAAVFRHLKSTDQHPSAEDVHRGVRQDIPGISIATIYKSLETLVGCGLVRKLSSVDGPARYDGRTDPHHHARCLTCGSVIDVAGELPPETVTRLEADAETRFRVTGYRLEWVGYCPECPPEDAKVPAAAGR
jgi:Fur family peroxide stress response transcriptional regulator